MIAQKIIAVARTGERCATALCDRALSELGCPTLSEEPPPPVAPPH
jgi:hypothetical protein